eukprot:CAMPEP_0204153962 /NCGR_PEP_ID=MMETSP0361-20130328/28312_1 /ASSEMBLY_ACC=CAM_ASM_000343 /TAXON_ID=268821 /ORGANISM="Scrippsiella Hangoei, Strain SHTV-5" /LENGTH=150 /DNA_ID=CAMNT_0051109157 /DNA_START=6 /DNA_END=455 /DNA_ORIENTATION=+
MAQARALPGAPGGDGLNASVILEEHLDSDHDPDDHEILEYAEWLGIDVEVDSDLLWIARASLKAPLPPPWKPCQAGDEGEIFYFNFESGESMWDHPCDGYHRKLYQRERAKKYGLPIHDSDDEEVIKPPGAPDLDDEAGLRQWGAQGGQE